ncbi:tetratricopeptide repeat protein [bacterium]|nr:tetratricopeptide repeat protein [bacterium]
MTKMIKQILLSAGILALFASCSLIAVRPPATTEIKLSDNERSVWAFFAGQLADQSGEFAKAVQYYQAALKYNPASTTLRRYLVSDLIRLERFQEAHAEYRILIENKPEDSETRYILGQLYAAVGDTALAERLYRDAIQLGSRISGPFTKLGIILLEQEQPVEGERYLREALEIDPHDREARRVLITYYHWKGKNQEAIDLLQAALDESSEDIEWLSGLAKMYDSLNQKEKAAAVYLRLSRAHPKTMEGYRFLSIYYLRRNDWEGAILQLEKLLKISPENLLARRNLGLAFFKIGKFDQARQQLEHLISAKVSDALTHYLMGSIYRQKGFKYLAVDEFRLAIRVDPDLVEAYLGLASVLLEINEAQNAVVVLREAGVRFSRIPQVLSNYGLVLLWVEEPKQAVKAFKKALRLTPEKPALHFHIGRAYFKDNQFKRAVAAWKQAIALDPKLAAAYNFLGYTHAERGKQLKQAEQWIKKALQLDPENGYYLDSLGWVYYKQEKYQRALEKTLAAKTALQEAGLAVESVIYDHLGDIYFKLRRYTEAEKAWKQALQVDPENRKIKDKLEKL